MERKHKITIPEPCHEDWSKMTPNENGRFCMSCSKTVVDFTSMMPEEIQHFFIQNQNNKICGRFRKSQLESITIQIPSRILYAQTNYYKMFLLALFVAMGTTLFSCADKNGNKKKIDKVEVVTNADPVESIMVGEPAIDENDTIHATVPPPPPPKIDQVKFVKPKEIVHKKSVTVTKDEKINSKKNNSSKEDPIYNGGIAVETNAEFPGGIEQFYNFIEKEFKNPENSESTNSKIILSFIVERNGSVTYLRSEPNIDDITEKEIARVFSLCPKWQPGETNGKKSRRLYSLPIVLQ